MRTLTLILTLGAVLAAGPTSAAAQTVTATAKPQATTKPDTTAKPQATTKPDATAKPQATAKPDTTAKPQATPKPDATAKPQATTKPDTTAKPQTTTKPDATAKPQAGAKPGAKPAAKKVTHLFVTIDGGAQVTTTRVDATVTYKVYGEDATLKATYKTKVVPVIGARAGMRVWRQLIVGAGASLFSNKGTAAIQAQVPHPFFFQRPRSVEGSASRVRRDETVIYGEIGWFAPVNPKVDLIVFAGPAFFNAAQDVATKVIYTEQYPFDAATFSSVASESKSISAVGFTAGVDVAYRVTKSLRVGALIRFSHATADVEPVAKQPFRITLGGLQTTAGIRLRF